MEGGLPEYDGKIDDDKILLLVNEGSDSENELDMKLHLNIDPLSACHLSCHLPKCAGCPGCDIGKTNKHNSRRRKQPKVLVVWPEAVE